MRSTIIRKASQDESKIIKQQQTLITANTLFQLKKLNNKVKITSDKTKTEQKNFYFNWKDMGLVSNKAR